MASRPHPPTVPEANAPARSPLERLVDRIDAATQDRRATTLATDTVPSGFPSLDRVLGGGFRRRDLVVLAGDVGSGKSALALGMALRSAAAGRPAVLLSGEMREDRVLERALALEGRAAVDDLRQGALADTARAAVGAAAVRLRDLPLTVRPLAGDRFDEVGEALAAAPPPALVVVDSLQLVEPPRAVAALEERVAAATQALKALALAHDAALLVTAHTPALAAGRADPRPALDDLGGLGAVKQQADVVLGIYREEMYRPGQGVEGATELLVLKNRNGPTGFVDLYFYARWLRFEDMLDPES
ncbi:MAG TPA: DnaB-like helicase C-terminal domain-containing protein [Gemmatimonadales bacterium]|nr:DnaB-like helicase C-terminal domain-containing protein [Gemmatimonadales bacterium]